jgi:hypothetical protein
MLFNAQEATKIILNTDVDVYLTNVLYSYQHIDKLASASSVLAYEKDYQKAGDIALLQAAVLQNNDANIKYYSDLAIYAYTKVPYDETFFMVMSESVPNIIGLFKWLRRNSE